MVTHPLKSTLVLLKNVNYKQAVKLWNYLNNNYEIKNKIQVKNTIKDDSSEYKTWIDEIFFLKHVVFSELEHPTTR